MNEEPTDPPAASDGQRRLAASLGIMLSGNESMSQVSRLITQAMHVPADEEALICARWYGISQAASMDRPTILWLIAQALAIRGREYDLVAWFLYRVAYRIGLRLDSPHDPRLKKSITVVLDEPDVLRSMTSEAKKGTLDKFGSLDHSSSNSKAYRRCRQLLVEQFGQLPPT